MPAPILAGIGAAGITAAMGKGPATVGLSAAGGVASYYIVDAARAKHDPMIGHAILTTASKTESDSLLAVNFSGAESGLVLIAILLVIGMIVYKCKNCLCLKCCGRQQKISKKKMERQALINLAQVANTLGPSIKRRTLVDQGDSREIIVGPGKKIPTLPTIKEEVEVTNGGKHTKEEIPHTIPQTTNTSPPLPPPYPSMSAEEDMELCSGLYSTIQDVQIINIP